MERHLTTQEVADLLNVSHTTATKHMARAGAADLGCGGKHSYRITEAELRAYLDSRRAAEPEPVCSPPAAPRRGGRKVSIWELADKEEANEVLVELRGDVGINQQKAMELSSLKYKRGSIRSEIGRLSEELRWTELRIREIEDGGYASKEIGHRKGDQQ